MSEWSAGYRAALADVARLAQSRGLHCIRCVAPGPRRSTILADLLTDLEGDALVIERQADNRIRRRRLAAVREADLFDEAPR